MQGLKPHVLKELISSGCQNGGVEEAQLGMKAMTPADFGTPISEWDVFFSAMVRFIEGYDIVICPVVAFPAQHCGFIMEKDKDLSFSYCFTYNLTGWPAAVVRG